MASLLLAIILTVSCIGIFQSINEPIFDQTHISYQFQMGYPKISDGISSFLIFGTINFFQPYDPIQTNKAIRTLATAGYLISGGMLSWTVFTTLNRRWFFIPFVILFYTSRYPYLWLSTELFASTFIMLALWSILNSYSYPYVSIFLD